MSVCCLVFLPLLAIAGAGDETALAPFETSVPVARRVDAYLDFLASDALGGRETGTLEGDITARYVASVFASLGLQPAGDEGGYLAGYELSSSQVDLERCRVAATVDGSTHEFTLLEEAYVRGFGATGYDVSAPLAFAGYGIVSEDPEHDSYEELDVSGRFVVVAAGKPEDADGLPGSWRHKRDAARERGAAGLLVVVAEDDERTEKLLSWVEASARKRSLQLVVEQTEAEDESDDDAPFPIVFVKGAAGERLLGLAGLDGETLRGGGPAARGLAADVLLDAVAHVEAKTITAHNVAGIVRGSDPARADEFVVISAHMDHIGRSDDGVINNGADDNATGTTTLLTVAEVLARDPPPRSVLLLAVSGEEKGLLGSRAWLANPTVPLEQLIADINIDMVGRNDPAVIGATPSPEHEDYNTLVARAVELAPASGLEVRWSVGQDRYRRKVDSYYHRSDHANFAKAGIPVVFFFAGEHEDYHRPGDTVDKIDRSKLGRMVRFVSHLASDVAAAPELPHALETLD